MKKQITIFLSLIFVLGLVPFISAGAENVIYSNQENHYSFSIPGGWEEMPESTVSEITNQVVQQTQEQSINYITGFQLEGISDLQYPYILVQEHKINTPSYSQINEIFESEEFSQNVNKKIDEYSEWLINASLESPYIDKERNIIFMNGEMDTSVGRIRALSAMYVGKYSMTQLNFYSTKTEYSENLSIFNQIIDSFEYEGGYEYNEAEAKMNDPKGIFEGATEKAVIGLIIGLVFGLALALSSRLKKKNDKKNKNNEKEEKEEKNLGNKNFTNKNPNTTGAVFLGLVTFILMILNVPYIWVVPIIFGARRLVKARKEKENKRFIVVGYFVVYLPILFWLVSAISLALEFLNNNA